MILESRRVVIEPLCNTLTNLLLVDIFSSNEDKSKTDAKLDLVGKVFAELMDVIEKRNIVSRTLLNKSLN